MKKSLIVITVVSAFLASCDSGGLKIEPTTVDNSTNNSVTNPPAAATAVNPCASYQNTGGQIIQGTFDGLDCVYAPTFVDAGNNLTVDMTIPNLASDGAHRFLGSLFVGQTYDTDAALTDAGIAVGGDGPVLTVEAGATLAFTSSSAFLIVNRGSQIFAVGTVNSPITFTSVSDVESARAATPSLAFDAVQQWGGMVINGFGITNKCVYTGTAGAANLATSDCHVDAEGAAGLDESQYGGDNNNDSSGRLEYVRVKHTGAQVANGDELNGISFGAVGRNTIVNNLEVYSTFDDGIEMFGGAVNFNNFVALYVRDDAIDIDEGYSGSITNALVIQAESDGNHCIEADGIGSFSSLTSAEIESIIAQGIHSQPTITNLTCIISPNTAATATHDPGAGWRLREGIFPTISDSMVVAIGADDQADSNDNYCLRIDNRSAQAAQDGDLVIRSSLFSCAQKDRGALPDATTVQAFAEAAGNQFSTIVATGANPTSVADTDLVILEVGSSSTAPIFSVALGSMVVDGAALAVTPTPVSGKLGGLTIAAPDWTADWTYGIHAGSRAIPLWFE
ncbi:MAG: hypothetical protein ACI9HA_002558 [Dinoroseobacter sp.]|jgi:hypothetical protein